MKLYDVKCPVCGHVNCNLYLEETDGWMECEECGSTTNSLQFGKKIRIPVFSLKEHNESRCHIHKAL